MAFTLLFTGCRFLTMCCALLFLFLGFLGLQALLWFFRDMGQIVAIFLQFGFWLTPIFWSVKILPERFRSIVQYNPVYYIIEGYRDSLIYNTWFWEKVGLSVQYWVITLLFFFMGAVVFRKLRPHFADVL